MLGSYPTMPLPQHPILDWAHTTNHDRKEPHWWTPVWGEHVQQMRWPVQNGRAFVMVNGMGLGLDQGQTLAAQFITSMGTNFVLP